MKKKIFITLGILFLLVYGFSLYAGIVNLKWMILMPEGNTRSILSPMWMYLAGISWIMVYEMFYCAYPREINHFTKYYHYILLAPFVAIFVVHYIW